MKKKRLAVTMILTSLTLAASMATPAMAAEKQIKVPRMTQQTTYEKMPGEKYRVREDNRFSYRKDGLIRSSMEEKYGNKRTVAYKYKNGLLSKVKINGKSSMDSYEWSEDGRTETIKWVETSKGKKHEIILKNTFDSAGRLKGSRERDNGELEFIRSVKYDKKGNLLSDLHTYYSKGRADGEREERNTYDKKGRLIKTEELHNGKQEDKIVYTYKGKKIVKRTEWEGRKKSFTATYKYKGNKITVMKKPAGGGTKVKTVYDSRYKIRMADLDANEDHLPYYVVDESNIEPNGKASDRCVTKYTFYKKGALKGLPKTSVSETSFGKFKGATIKTEYKYKICKMTPFNLNVQNYFTPEVGDDIVTYEM